MLLKDLVFGPVILPVYCCTFTHVDTQISVFFLKKYFSTYYGNKAEVSWPGESLLLQTECPGLAEFCKGQISLKGLIESYRIL